MQAKVMHDWKNLHSETLDTLQSTDIWKVMQYTGLKDHDRRDIYDSDILQSKKGGLQTVVWNEARGCWAVTNPISEHKWKLGDFCRYSNVVGNIYEHPNLLTDKK